MDLSTLKKEFKEVPKGFGPVPFWFWNDNLDEKHLLYQIKEMHEKGIEEFIIHARRGLTVEYLSEEWFDKIAFTLREAAARGMGAWIYDENNWPSGYADGKVLAENPDFQVKYLNRAQAGSTIPADAEIITESEGMVYYRGYTKHKTAYSDAYYVDVLDREATLAFIKYTHEEYYIRFKEYFGNVIKGFFVDEPGFTSNFDYYAPLRYPGDDRFGIMWTDKLPDYFKEKKGYNILPNLKHIWKDVDSTSYKYRVDYYDVLGLMYRENFLGALRMFCEDHGVKLIGHLHIEDFLPYHVKTQGDIFKGIGELSMSGIDKIDLNSDKVTEKYASSAEHFYEMERTLSETFAISGWGLDTNEIRRWTNWQYVRGINMMVPHAFYSSIEDFRVKECPPSLFYQNYYWKYFKQYSDFVKRLGYILTRGTHSCPVAVYYPITSHQELVLPDSLSESKARDRQLIEVCTGLLDNQIDYEFVNDEGLLISEIDNGSLVIKDEKYKAIILIGVCNMPKATLKAIVKFMQSGGAVAIIGETELQNTDGIGDDEYSLLADILLKSRSVGRWRGVTALKRYSYQSDCSKLKEFLYKNKVPDFIMVQEDPDIKYMRRELDQGILYYIINEGKTDRKFDFIIHDTGRLYKLNPHNGSVELYNKTAYETDEMKGIMEVTAYVERYGEILLLVKPESIESAAALIPDLEESCLNSDAGVNNILDISKYISKYSTYTRHNLIDGWKVKLIEAYTYEGIDEGKREAELIQEEKEMPLTEWRKWGMPHFSGIVRYSKELQITKEAGYQYILDLGKVCYCVEVEVNGKKAAEIIWDPYMVNITDFLQDGENTLTLYVSNMLGSTLERKSYPSGLVGPVGLVIGK